jgi:hypothetical protein
MEIPAQHKGREQSDAIEDTSIDITSIIMPEEVLRVDAFRRVWR